MAFYDTQNFLRRFPRKHSNASHIRKSYSGQLREIHYSVAFTVALTLTHPQDNIPDSMLKKLKKYIENPKFVPETVEKTSKACKSMCLWVRALDLYSKVYRTVEPKRER